MKSVIHYPYYLGLFHGNWGDFIIAPVLNEITLAVMGEIKHCNTRRSVNCMYNSWAVPYDYFCSVHAMYDKAMLVHLYIGGYTCS